ncbi:MAG: enoyl-CoA hydratase/isomerase family protein [Holosporaceae bacterium]|jgi:enoyl-CoA hydratase/carnithine racemase|nr:enoyl-CoA hydratase/isomerase family protein [Holosporaceae bacterium]
MSIDLSVDNSVAILRLYNPGKLNALSSDFMNELHEKVQNIDQKANVLIVAGCEKAFSAGIDIAEVEQHSGESACLENFIDSRWECIFHVKIPVIAVVSGYALGGGFELALMCDIIVATETAKFGFPEINLGLMPGMGGTQLLTRIVGAKIASKILMTGDSLSALEAKELGIVTQVVLSGDLMPVSLELAQRISRRSRMSLRMIKNAIRLSQNVGLNQGINSERLMFRSLFSSADKKKKTKEFLRKRLNS